MGAVTRFTIENWLNGRWTKNRAFRAFGTMAAARGDFILTAAVEGHDGTAENEGVTWRVVEVRP